MQLRVNFFVESKSDAIHFYSIHFTFIIIIFLRLLFPVSCGLKAFVESLVFVVFVCPYKQLTICESADKA